MESSRAGPCARTHARLLIKLTVHSLGASPFAGPPDERAPIPGAGKQASDRMARAACCGQGRAKQTRPNLSACAVANHAEHHAFLHNKETCVARESTRPSCWGEGLACSFAPLPSISLCLLSHTPETCLARREVSYGGGAFRITLPPAPSELWCGPLAQLVMPHITAKAA